MMYEAINNLDYLAGRCKEAMLNTLIILFFSQGNAKLLPVQDKSLKGRKNGQRVAAIYICQHRTASCEYNYFLSSVCMGAYDNSTEGIGKLEMFSLCLILSHNTYQIT